MTYKTLYDELKVLVDSDKEEDLLWLLREYFNLSPTDYLLNKNNEISIEEVNSFKQLASKFIDEYVPVQYLVGYTYFYGRKIFVNKDVLIPRRETEDLVFRTINKLKEEYTDLTKLQMLDLGTGSGAIGISFKIETNANVDISDVSSEALVKAKENIGYYNLDINVIESSWFDNINKKYDVIISNPPYISREFDLEHSVLKEPNIALFSDNDGTLSYSNILKDVFNYLKPGGLIAFEHGYDQHEALRKLAKHHLTNYKIIQELDIQGLERYTFIYKSE